MERFRLEAQRVDGKAYVEFVRTADMSVGVYRLPVGATDAQPPHGEEEIYHVMRGKARFTSGGEDIAVAVGDVLLVPAREPHRFYEITEELELLVFFAPPETA
jgi:mannose-6-phosphate isomerase-like protein (cupin superfamily)